MTAAMNESLLKPGFGNQVLDSQACFRAALRSLSRPGSVMPIDLLLEGPTPLGAATTALCLSLLDADTRVWLDPLADTPGVRTYLRFHCGCPLVREPLAAQFAVVIDPSACPSLDAFDIGDEQYPDRSATIIFQLAAFTGGEEVILSGPGVNGEAAVSPRGLPEGFAAQWAANRTLFPQGVDILFTANDQIMGLPRSIDWRS